MGAGRRAGGVEGWFGAQTIKPEKNNPSFLISQNVSSLVQYKNNPIKTSFRGHKSCFVQLQPGCFVFQVRYSSSAELFLPSFGQSQRHHPALNHSLFS